MRMILLAAGLLPLSLVAARADSCGDLIDRVVADAPATLVNRTVDFAELTAGDGMTLTLACGDPSSVGAQFRGSTPPATYFALFGRAGKAVTGIAPDVIETAARTAREQAVTTRHSHVDAGAALVTCSVTASAGNPVTGCAVIDKGDRR